VDGTLFVNTGTVGKPKDGDSRADYPLLTLGRRSRVEFRRIAFDVQAVSDAIEASALPDEFAELLILGG
jgi:hypothetical protein